MVAIQVVILSLSATDAMSDAVAGGTGADVTSLLSGVTNGLAAAAADPTIASFVLLLIALLIAVAAFVLWIELLIRAAAVYVAVLFLPLALATLVWPAVSHWCRRLVETLAALILSKFVIVATLSLAAGAVSSGTAGGGAHGAGFSAVLAGGALLVMATFVPFAILRMIPAVEAGAVGHLDGLRARGTAAVTRPARSAASHALHGGLEALGDARLMAQTEGGAGGGGLAGSGRGPLAARGGRVRVLGPAGRRCRRARRRRPRGPAPLRGRRGQRRGPGTEGTQADHRRGRRRGSGPRDAGDSGGAASGADDGRTDPARAAAVDGGRPHRVRPPPRTHGSGRACRPDGA